MGVNIHAVADESFDGVKRSCWGDTIIVSADGVEVVLARSKDGELLLCVKEGTVRHVSADRLIKLTERKP